MTQHIVLLTAAIRTRPGVPALARTDPDQRRADYRRAFRFYVGLLGRGPDRLVFVENSGADLSDFEGLAREAGAADRVEFVSFDGQDFPPEYGRGYNEFRAVDRAVEQARAFAEAGDDAVTWKMTGRYVMTNFGRFFDRAPKGFDLLCNLRNRPYPLADLYLLGWSRAGYEGLIRGLAPRLREDTQKRTPEESFRELVDANRGRYRIVPRFHMVPRIDAVRGTDNRNYIGGLSGWGKLLARRVALHVTPWLWI